MKILKKRKITILLLCIAICGTTLVGIKTVHVSAESSPDLVDDGVYFIRNQRSNLYIDMPNGGANGTTLIQYTLNTSHSDNQRFVIKKWLGEMWQIRPYNLNGRLSVSSAENETPVTIFRTDALLPSSNNLFKIERETGGSGAFVIKTSVSNYEKCLTVHYASYSAGTDLIQYSYINDGNTDNDHWYFEPVTDLCINQIKDCYIAPGGKNIFDIQLDFIVQSVPYIIETTGNNDTYLELYGHETLLLSNDDSGTNLNAKIIFTPQKDDNYKVRVRLFSSVKSGSFKIVFRPLNEVYCNTYSAQDDIDTIRDADQYKYFMNLLGYYCNHANNSSFDYMNKESANGRSRFNNDYYFISSHGSQNGWVFLSQTEQFLGRQLPDMSQCRVALFAICYGGAEGNVAEICANEKNAHNAIGFPGLTYTDTSKIFTDFFWEYIREGNTPRESSRLALQDTLGVLWWHSWGDDTIVSPIIYGEEDSAVTSSLHVYDENCEFLSGYNEVSYEQYMKFISQENIVDMPDSRYQHIHRMVKTINGIPTNEYMLKDEESQKYYTNGRSVDNNTSFNAKLQQIPVRLSISGLNFEQIATICSEIYYLDDEGVTRVIKRSQILYAEKTRGYECLNEVYTDLNTGEVLSMQEIIKLFWGIQ